MGQRIQGDRIARAARWPALGALFLVPVCASAQDLGIFYGTPTPALAMYAAQVEFAASTCVAEGFVEDAKGAALFLKQFNNSIQFRKYSKDAPEFVANLATFSGNYRTAWSTAAPEVRQQFCQAFQGEILAKREHWVRWAAPLTYFRNKFSPMSERSAQKQRNIVGALSAAGSIATNAASISAGRDAIAMTKAGDYPASLQQMDVSRNFHQAGAAFVEAGRMPEGAPIAPTSVLEEKDADGTVRIVRCPVTDHFFSYSAPLESGVWTTYQTVSMACREPLPTDFQ